MTTNTTTTETRNKRDDRMSNYRRDIKQLGELPSADDLARPIVKALFDLVEAFDGRAETLEYLFEFDGADRAEAAAKWGDETRRCVEVARDVMTLVSVSVANMSPMDGASEYHRESAMASVLRPLLGNVGTLDSLLLRPELYMSLYCAAVET